MLIITAVGPDTPGMAHAVAQILFESGCNIEDTTMTRLSGQFSMILAVETPASLSLDELREKTDALRASYQLVVDVTPVEETQTTIFEGPRYLLTAYGPENVGLLAHLTGTLAAENVNVTDVQTRVASAGQLYIMLLEVELPPDLAPETLEAQLQSGADDLQISLRLIEEDTL